MGVRVVLVASNGTRKLIFGEGKKKTDVGAKLRLRPFFLPDFRVSVAKIGKIAQIAKNVQKITDFSIFP